MKKISIIIPVFNESQTIQFLLQHILHLIREQQDAECYEVICVDGGSSDNTLQCIRDWIQTHDDLFPIDIYCSDFPGRAKQMNLGAKHATGKVLLFLHADTSLPDVALQQISLALQQGFQWGRFDVRLSGKQWTFRIIERMINWRSRLTAIATGDQALFITQARFTAVGGFPDQGLMEDIELCKRLRQQRFKPFCSHHKVTTSSRRWESRGVVKTVLLMWWLRWRYFMGASPEMLKKLYR